MKTLVCGFVFMCALAGSCVSAFAQIIITAADVTSRLAVGNTIVNVADTTTVSANIGSPGSTSWDFSGLQSHGATTLHSVAPSSTPLSAQFPGTTHALKTTLTGSIVGIPGPVTGDMFLFLKVGTSSLLNPGSMADGSVDLGPPFGTVPGQIKTTNSPDDTTYALPSTLGTTWGSTYTATQAITVSGIPFTPTMSNRKTSYTVDAFGTLKIPGGSLHDALRIRRVDTGSGKSIGYIFLAKDGASVQLTASDTSSPNNGTIPVSKGSITWSGAFITSVPVAPGVPGEFALLQNYPNPFNPATTLTYQLPTVSRVKLVVYDVVGNAIAALVDGRQTAGPHTAIWNASGSASGVYFATLQAFPENGTGGSAPAPFERTVKMLLIR